MNNIQFFIIVIFGTLGLMIFLNTFINWIYNRIDKNHRKQYPYYFELKEEYDRLYTYNYTYYNTFIEPVKEEIDYLLENMKYLTEETKREKEKVLEKNRKELSTYLTEYEKSSREMEDLRKALRSYVEVNNIEKWAGTWKSL